MGIFMNILMCQRVGGAWGYITDSIINALRDKGHKVQRWDGHLESWYEFNPDLYIGCSGHRQPIPAKHNAKIAIHVNPYGPVNLKGINESDDAIRWTLNQKPDVVFGYGQEEDRILWSYWTKRHGIPWVPLPTAGDKTLYKLIDTPKSYDIVYLGGRWPYKALSIDAFLVPVLKESSNYKLHGWGDWQPGLCSGILAEDQTAIFLNSGKVGPCISEKHTHEYGIDIPERAFKVALCGALVVHDPVVQIKRMIPSALVASNADQFKEYCLLYTKPDKEEERKTIAMKQREEVLAAHTYHHRVAAVFKQIGFEEEAERMILV